MVKFSPETAAAFEEWFPEHQKMFPGISWPQAEDDRIGIFPALATVLVRNGIVDVDHLFEVTRRMVLAGEKAFDLQGHIQILVRTAIAFHREHYRPEDAFPVDSIEAARAMSKACPVCSGMGIFLAHRQKSASPERRDNTINVYCSCAYGRKIRENHMREAPETFRRFYDAVQYPFLEEEKYRFPALPEAVAVGPEAQPAADRPAF